MNNEKSFEERMKNFIYKFALAITMLICIFLLCFLTLKPTDALSKYLKENSYDNLYLEIGYEDGSSLSSVGYIQYPHLDEKLQYYSLPYINVPFARDMTYEDGSEIPLERILIVDKDKSFMKYWNYLSDDKIYFPDYMADMILNYNPYPFDYKKKSYEDFIGSTVNFAGHSIEVGEVIRTGYMSNVYRKKNMNFENFYETALITKNTFEKLLKFDELISSVYVRYDNNLGKHLDEDIKILYDSNLVGDEILVSKDLIDEITEDNNTVNRLDIYPKESSLLYLGYTTLNVDIKGVIEDENIINTIYISYTKENMFKGFNTEFWSRYNDCIDTGTFFQVIPDEELTDNDILVSKDMNVSEQIQLMISGSNTYPQSIYKFNVVGTIEDEVRENSIYVSQLVYDNFIATKLKGGVITFFNFNPGDLEEFIPKLKAEDMYFKIEPIDEFIKLNNFLSWWIAVFILMEITFISIFGSFIIKKINLAKASNFKDIFVVTFKNSYAILYICFVLFLIIPINKIFEKMYYEYLKVDFIFLILYLLIFYLLTCTIVSLYFRYKTKKSDNLLMKV